VSLSIAGLNDDHFAKTLTSAWFFCSERVPYSRVNWNAISWTSEFFFSRRYYLIIRRLDARVFIFNYAAKKRAHVTTNRESISSDLSPFSLRITSEKGDSHPNCRKRQHPKEQRLPAVGPSQLVPLRTDVILRMGNLSFTKERVPRRIGDSPIKLKTAKLIALRLYYSSDPPSVLASVFQCHDLNDIRRNQDREKKRETCIVRI